MTRLRLALVGVALELAPGCGDTVASSSFASGPHALTSSASSAGDTSTSSSASSGTTSGEDSGGSAGASLSGTSTGSTSSLDTGMVPDFGDHPIGCQGKVDFLFVISSWYSMKDHQVQLQEAFPAFTELLAEEFADFDYHIMVVDAGGNALLNKCDACYDCTGCMKPGCGEYGGPEDYPCKGPFEDCDAVSGAGVTITGNFGATNARCDLFGDNRYIVKGEPMLEEKFECIATLGEGPKTSVPMIVMQDALEPAMLKGGCNDGFLRKDALLAVVVLDDYQDELSPGTPQDWYEALVAAKKGDEEAIVTLVLSGDTDLPNPQCSGLPSDPNPLRLFAEAAAHGRYESICTPSYVPALEATAATILEQCSLLIPQ